MIDKEEDLSDQDKRSLLVKALSGPEAKKEMDRVLQYTDTYEDAVAALKERCEQPKVVFTHHLTTYFKSETLGGNLKDIQSMRDQIRTVHLGFKASQGNSLSQVIAEFIGHCTFRTFIGCVLRAIFLGGAVAYDLLGFESGCLLTFGVFSSRARSSSSLRNSSSKSNPGGTSTFLI